MWGTVNEEQNNVVLYNKASGETSVLDYSKDTSLMYIYGPRISTHFNFIPLNHSYVKVSDLAPQRKLITGYPLSKDELKLAHDMLNSMAMKHGTYLKWGEKDWLSGGYLSLYNKILECMYAIKNGSNIFWQLPEAHLHPAIQCELPNLFLRLIYKGYWEQDDGLNMLREFTGKDVGLPDIKLTEQQNRKTTKPLVITSNSEHIILRTQRLISDKNISHKSVRIMHMDI